MELKTALVQKQSAETKTNATKKDLSLTFALPHVGEREDLWPVHEGPPLMHERLSQRLEPVDDHHQTAAQVEGEHVTVLLSQCREQLALVRNTQHIEVAEKGETSRPWGTELVYAELSDGVQGGQQHGSKQQH